MENIVGHFISLMLVSLKTIIIKVSSILNQYVCLSLSVVWNDVESLALYETTSLSKIHIEV